ncbi:MAG: HAMP domain-containing histidine kinase [Burkholderiaceae bacterium]|nr:HAMP domain-containing histidine kinase [Burkholderiaceae bacterium]
MTPIESSGKPGSKPPGRLFWKFLFSFWLSLMVTGIVVGSLVSLYQRPPPGSPAEISTTERSSLGIAAVATILRYGGVETMRGILEDRRRHGSLHVFVVDDNDQDLLGRPVSEAAVREALRAAESNPEGQSAQQVTAPDGRTYLVFVPLAKSGLGRLRWRSEPLPPSELLVIGLLASLVVSMMLAWYLSKPISNLRWAFAAVALGRLDTRVAPLMGSRRGEIADLGHEFDTMARRLQELMAAQRQLLHDVSHEIRSPLARLDAAVGLARQDPARFEETIERIERETNRLDQLIGELLTLSRLESDAVGDRRELVDLMELIVEVCEDARFEAQASGRTLDYSSDGTAYARVQSEMIYRAIENVVRNAVKYSPPGARIEVEVQQQPPGRLLLRVLDRGPGVAEEDLPRLFEPFFRGRDAGGGFGLGLAIARQAVLVHGGSIEAANREGGGLVVEISLPLTPG